MRRIDSFLVIFYLFAGCQAPVSDLHNKGTEPGKKSQLPFDSQARLVFTKHARCRMDCRHITANEIREVLDEGNINYEKSEPHAQPDPKWALEGYTKEQQHLRIIIAPEAGKLVVITCIELGVEWRCDCN
jgi:hypothetical protein